MLNCITVHHCGWASLKPSASLPTPLKACTDTATVVIATMACASFSSHALSFRLTVLLCDAEVAVSALKTTLAAAVADGQQAVSMSDQERQAAVQLLRQVVCLLGLQPENVFPDLAQQLELTQEQQQSRRETADVEAIYARVRSTCMLDNQQRYLRVCPFVGNFAAVPEVCVDGFVLCAKTLHSSLFTRFVHAPAVGLLDDSQSGVARPTLLFRLI